MKLSCPVLICTHELPSDMAFLVAVPDRNLQLMQRLLPVDHMMLDISLADMLKVAGVGLSAASLTSVARFKYISL